MSRLTGHGRRLYRFGVRRCGGERRVIGPRFRARRAPGWDVSGGLESTSRDGRIEIPPIEVIRSRRAPSRSILEWGRPEEQIDHRPQGGKRKTCPAATTTSSGSCVQTSVVNGSSPCRLVPRGALSGAADAARTSAFPVPRLTPAAPGPRNTDVRRPPDPESRLHRPDGSLRDPRPRDHLSRLS